MTQIADKIWAEQLPEGNYGEGLIIEVDGKHYLNLIDENGEMLAGTKPLPPGTYRFLFTTKNVKIIPNGIVECKIVEYDGEIKGTRFVNYTNPNQRYWYINKTDSFKSLLRSKNLDPKNNYAIIEKLGDD